MGTQLPQKGAQPHPNFRPMSIVAKRLDVSRCLWYGGRPRPRRHCVRWRLSSFQRGTAPNLRPMPFVAKRLYESGYHLVPRKASAQATLCYTETQLPFPKGTQPQFSARVRCGQTAGWTKMPLGMEVGLGPGDFVLDEDPAPPKKAQPHPIFGPCLLWPNCWMDQDATWYGGRPRPRRRCVRRGSSSPKKGTAPSFRPMSIVTKRLDG